MENKKSKWKILKPCLGIELFALLLIFDLSLSIFDVTRKDLYDTVQERFTALYGDTIYTRDISCFTEEQRVLNGIPTGAGAIIQGMNEYYKAVSGPVRKWDIDYKQKVEDYKDCIRVKVSGRMPYYADGHTGELNLDGSSALLSFTVVGQTEGNAGLETVRKEYIWDLSRYLSKQQFDELVSLATDSGELYVMKLWGYRDADGIVPTRVSVKDGYFDHLRDIQFTNATDNAPLLYERSYEGEGKSKFDSDYAGIYICQQSDEWKDTYSNKRKAFTSIYSDRYRYGYKYATLLDGKEITMSGETESGVVHYDVQVDINLITKRKAGRKILLLALWIQLGAFICMLYPYTRKGENGISKDPSEVRTGQISWRNSFGAAFGVHIYSALKLSGELVRSGPPEDLWMFYAFLFPLIFVLIMISLIGFLREGRKQRNTQNNPTES